MNGSIPDVDASQVLTPHIWPTDSVVQLMSVLWDSAYRDVVAWESAEARDAWFEDHKTSSWFQTNFQNIRPGEPIAVPVPYSSVYKYNYIVVTNPKQPVEYEGPARSYFYFITSVEYLSAQATRLTVQLDVMTTYAGSIEFGRAYVESGHVGMANSNLLTTDTGKPTKGYVLNRYMDLPEGVDCGNTLTPCSREFYNLCPKGDATQSYIMIMSTADLESDPGSVDNPSLVTAKGQQPDGLVSGCNVYAIDRDDFETFMQKCSFYPWVSQCIISIWAYPKILTLGHGSDSLKNTEIFGIKAVKVPAGFSISSAQPGTQWTSGNVFDALAKGLGDDADIAKLYAYPYSVIELSSLNGNPVYLKPQFLRGYQIALSVMANSLMPFAKAGVYPNNYGDESDTNSKLTFNASAIGYSGEVTVSSGDFLDTCVWVTDFPQFSIVNNAYLTYMASTAHTRAYQYQSAGWQLAKGNMQAANAYSTSVNAANASQQMGELSASAQRANNAVNYNAGMQNLGTQALAGYANAGISTITGAANGAIGGGIAGGVLGGISGGASGFINTYANSVMGATSLAAQRSTADNTANVASINAATAGNVARKNAGLDYNTALAVNQGDYKNAVAAVNATVQDAQLTPPSTVGQMGGNGFNWANGFVGVMVTYKTITGAARRAVADYFRRYGYAVKRFMQLGTPDDMRCMTRFAYWRVMESNITCAQANESERETMRGILEKGVTFWDAPESIGTVDVRDNKVRTDGHTYTF